MPWLPSLQTGNLIGVAEAAAHVVNAIVTRHARKHALPRLLNNRLMRAGPELLRRSFRGRFCGG